MIEFYKTIFLNYFKDLASPILKDLDYPFILRDKIKSIKISSLHVQLIYQGYFTKSSVEDILKTMKLKDLKNILESYGILSTGRKNTNIEKIKKLSFNQIEHYLPNNYNEFYSLTEKAYDYIKNNNDYILILKHYEFPIDVSLYNAFRNNNHSFFETCEKMFLSQLTDVMNLKTSYSKKIMFRYLSKLYDMYQLKEKALFYAMADLYIELSGNDIVSTLELKCINSASRKERINNFKLRKLKKEILSEFNYYISPQQDTINIIYKNKDVFNVKMVDNIYDINLMLNLCPKEYFICIVYDIFNETFNKNKAINQIENNFKKTKIEI